MKTIYITGSTAGLYPDEIDLKFKPILEEVMQMLPQKITCTSEIENTNMDWTEKLNEKLKAVSEADIVLFTNDWKETIDSQLEFREASQRGKEIRLYNAHDMFLIEKSLSKVQVYG